MKKFFLDQFTIQTVSFDHNGNLKLHCSASHEDNNFHFYLYLTKKEFNILIDNLKEQGLKIKRMLSRVFFAGVLQTFKRAVLVDCCWLSIKVLEYNDPEIDHDKEFCVENFGFMPA